METSFGQSFEDVRIHTSAPALPRDVAAEALGKDIHFAPGFYQPGTDFGRRLLAHELTHVVQQARPDWTPRASANNCEQEANSASASVMNGNTAQVRGSAPRAPQNQTADEAAILAAIAAIDQQVSNPVSQSPQALEALMQQRSALMARLGPTPALSPAEATEQMLLQRQWAASPGGGRLHPAQHRDMQTLNGLPAEGALTAEQARAQTLALRGRAAGTGFQTNAVVQVIDGNGNQVATELAQYNSSQHLHAEAQAADRLARRLSGRQIPGGRLIVAVDQLACPACQARLRQLAEMLGLERVQAWTPGRPGAAPGRASAGPKWTARTAATAPPEGAPPGQAGQQFRAVPELTFEHVLPPSSPAAPTAPAEALPVAPPVPEAAVTPPASETAPPTARGGLRGLGGTALGVGSFALPFIYGPIHQRRVQQRADQEGYVPVGPRQFANEGFLSRLGRIFLDPTLDSGVDARGRINIPVYRQRLREATANVPPGGTYTMPFQYQHSGTFGTVTDDFVLTYQRSPNGTFVLQPNPSLPITPPDINIIMDPAVSDEAVYNMIFRSPMTA